MPIRPARHRPRLRSHVVALATALVAAAALATAAGPPLEAPEAGYTVRLEHFSFAPATLSVPVGATVRWQNLDAEPHTVVGIDGLFRSGALDQGESFVYTFRTAGSYRYVCSIHPQMVGTILVKAAP